MKVDRSGTIIELVVYLLLAAGGVWLIVKFDISDSLVNSGLHALGYVLAGQGVWMAAREFRRLFEPEVVAAQQAEEAEREKEARERPATLASAVFFWLVTLLVIGGFIFYALDDSGEHGERTLPLTLLFGGITFSMVSFTAWTTLSWSRHRNARRDESAAACT